MRGECKERSEAGGEQIFARSSKISADDIESFALRLEFDPALRVKTGAIVETVETVGDGKARETCGGGGADKGESTEPLFIEAFF